MKLSCHALAVKVYPPGISSMITRIIFLPDEAVSTPAIVEVSFNDPVLPLKAPLGRMLILDFSVPSTPFTGSVARNSTPHSGELIPFDIIAAR